MQREANRWLLGLAAVAACGRSEAPRSTEPVATASDAAVAIDAGGRDVSDPDAAIDAAIEAAIEAPVDAAVADEERALRVGQATTVDVRAKRPVRWRVEGGEAWSGRAEWTDGPAGDDAARRLALSVWRGDALVWSCEDECPLAPTPGTQDLGVVAARDGLYLALMWMNKGNYIPEAVIRLRWRRGAVVVDEIDPTVDCPRPGRALWPEYCDGGD